MYNLFFALIHGVLSISVLIYLLSIGSKRPRPRQGVPIEVTENPCRTARVPMQVVGEDRDCAPIC
jgi:hypothetical protein